MVMEKIVSTAGKWVNGKWVKSKALKNFSTKPTSTPLETNKVYTKIKLEHSPVTDCYTSRFVIPTTKVESVNVGTFLKGLKDSKYSKPPVIPTDIPEHIDFSTATKGIVGRVVPVHDKEGKLVREYISRNGKDLFCFKEYDVATGKVKLVVNYNTTYGKTLPSHIKELDPSTGHEVKRALYWDKTEKLKGVTSKDEMGREIVVKYKENGIDIDYVTNNGISVYKS